MFNISILLIPPWGKRFWQDRAPRSTRGWQPSGLQHWKSSNGKYHPQPGLCLPANTAAAGSNNQSGGPAQQQTSGHRTKLGRLDQTNDPVCGKVARLFKQRGDSFCSLLFIAAFIWGGRIDFVKARRLSHPRGWRGAEFVRQSRLCGTELPQWMEKEPVHRGAIILLR